MSVERIVAEKRRLGAIVIGFGAVFFGVTAGAQERSLEPTPIIKLKAAPKVVFPKGDAEQESPEPKLSAALEDQRIKLLASRDASVVPDENLPAHPRQFCVGARCFSSYKQVVAALYPAATGADKLTVFCAPRRLPGASAFDPKDPLRNWEIDKVQCSANWGDTLNYKPWTPSGEPSSPAEDGVIPPYACFGNPHMLLRHMVLAPGGVAGQSGFVCRRRVYRVQVKRPVQSIEDQRKNIAQMCTEMRQQVWGEKYGDINSEYQKWCRAQGRNDCLPDSALKPGGGVMPTPFMQLSREELLFFYGHQELYCRADRPGLTHFLYNEPWAKSFTCGVARGVLEAGPFEEGVQVCALAPYYGERVPAAKLRDPFKARFHCWKFNRPTCEDVSRDQTKDDIHRSNVFDAFDALREFRRTRRRGVFGLYDLKDAEKLADFNEAMSFSDTGKDEGVFGVKEFCRFLGDTKTIQCGYDKHSLTQWYELRRLEEPARCAGGICARGAYQRGYLCGLFATPEMFDGKPYWMCGLDVGKAGRDKLRTARALCLGGKAVSSFHSPKGDRSSLQCYERRFRWGESEKSRAVLKRLDWPKLVSAAGKDVGEVAPYGKPARSVADADDRELVEWAKAYSHTLGHLTSLRIGLMRSKVGAVVALSKLKFTALASTKGLSANEPPKRLKSLNEAMTELLSGDTAPDDKWLKGFEMEAREGGELLIAPVEEEIVLRVVRLFRVLDRARAELLKTAQQYAAAVRAHGKTQGLLSRLELHERARAEQLDEKLKGTVFCVAESAFDPKSSTGTPSSAARKNRFVCASSALLPAGAVESIVIARGDEFRPVDGTKPEDHPQQYAEFKQKVRKQVKTEWCYGSTKGSALYGPHASPALFGLDLSSPYLMEAGRGVIELETAAMNKNDQRKWKSGINWLKCAGFQYSDEHWQHAVPGGGRNAPATRVAGADRDGLVGAFFVGVGGGDASAVTGMVGGLVGKLIDMVIPGLGDSIARVRDMAHHASEFLDKWAGRYIETAKKVWDEGKKKVEEAKKTIEEAEKAFRDKARELADAREKAGEMLLEASQKADDLIKDGMDEVARAEVFAASAIGPAKEQAAAKVGEAKEKLKDIREKAKELITTAKEKSKELTTTAKQASDAAGKEFDRLRKDGEKELSRLRKENKMIHGSGELLGEMLEDLTNQILRRVMDTVEPKARALFAKGFRFVRNVLGAVAKAVISALGSIPFVGGALAVLGQIAYEMGLNALEDWAFENLLGVVERVFAKTVRGLLSTVMKEVQAQISKLVFAACASFGVCSDDGEMKFGALPPKHQWLERAVGCTRGALIDGRAQARAVAARREIVAMGEDMRARAPLIARNMATQYLARFGVTLDEVIAAARGDRAAYAIARVDEVKSVLRRTAERARRGAASKPAR